MNKAGIYNKMRSSEEKIFVFIFLALLPILFFMHFCGIYLVDEHWRGWWRMPVLYETMLHANSFMLVVAFVCLVSGVYVIIANALLTKGYKKAASIFRWMIALITFLLAVLYFVYFIPLLFIMEGTAFLGLSFPILAVMFCSPFYKRVLIIPSPTPWVVFRIIMIAFCLISIVLTVGTIAAATGKPIEFIGHVLYELVK